MSEKPDQDLAEQSVNSPRPSGFFLFRIAASNRAGVLVIALMGRLLLMAPSADQYFLSSLSQATVILAVIFAAVYNRRHLTIALAIGIPGILLSLLADYTAGTTLNWVALAVFVVLYLFTLCLMLTKIFTTKVVARETIGLAVSTYILLGWAWAMFYLPVAQADPNAFNQTVLQEGTGPGSTLVYFSFVTLTTLGYGDISPVSGLARSLAITEALTGTLFLTVLISRLIGAYNSRGK